MNKQPVLAYQCFGCPERPPLLLLHGFLGSQQEWKPWLERLTRHWYCVCVDLPGHGLSSTYPLPKRGGFNALTTALAELMRTLHSEPWAIWGYSLGGRIALYLSLKQSLSLRWLLLESAHPGLSSKRQRQLRRASDERWAQQLEQQDMSAFLAGWYRQPVFSHLSEEQRYPLIKAREQNDPATLAVMLRATSLAIQPAFDKKVGQLSCPWCYLAGAKDAKFAAIANSFSPSVRHILPAAGHNIHRERPELLWSCLQSFLIRSGLVKELQ